METQSQDDLEVDHKNQVDMLMNMANEACIEKNKPQGNDINDINPSYIQDNIQVAVRNETKCDDNNNQTNNNLAILENIIVVDNKQELINKKAEELYNNHDNYEKKTTINDNIIYLQQPEQSLLLNDQTNTCNDSKESENKNNTFNIGNISALQSEIKTNGTQNLLDEREVLLHNKGNIVETKNVIIIENDNINKNVEENNLQKKKEKKKKKKTNLNLQANRNKHAMFDVTRLSGDDFLPTKKSSLQDDITMFNNAYNSNSPDFGKELTIEEVDEIIKQEKLKRQINNTLTPEEIKQKQIEQMKDENSQHLHVQVTDPSMKSIKLPEMSLFEHNNDDDDIYEGRENRSFSGSDVDETVGNIFKHKPKGNKQDNNNNFSLNNGEQSNEEKIRRWLDDYYD